MFTTRARHRREPDRREPEEQGPAHRAPRRRGLAIGAAGLALAMLAGACGGGDDGDGGGTASDGADDGTPQSGGEVVYALEAENSGGWCLPEAQLAISGIQVARTIYDTLTIPDADGNYVGQLAESVTPNADFTQWTITLRDGITFHDGSPLTAEVVKDNLDAYRGAYPARQPLLFIFVFDNITSVDVVDTLSLTVTTKAPWPALPAFLWGSGRTGILAQAQLDDPDTCDRNLIGTGPFKLMDGGEWVVNDHLTAVRNDDYWRTDGDGTRLPYLDRITYRPIPNDTARVNALLAGDVNALHTNWAESIESLEASADSGGVTLTQSDVGAEVSYAMFNTSKAPFDSATARRAIATAIDREQFRQVITLDQATMASGPFATGTIGYLEDAGYPEHDPAEAEDLVADYEQECGCDFEFTLNYQNDPGTKGIAEFIQGQASDVGVEVSLRPIEQAALIDTTLGADWQATYWRNHPGGDPDQQYVWWHSGSPVNFGRIDDPELDALLETGRVETDPAERQAIYEDVNRRFASEVYNAWTNWSIWTIATAPEVHGVEGPDLPDGSTPTGQLSVGHAVDGMWVSQ